MGKIERIDKGGGLESSMTFAVIITGVVPIGMDQRDLPGWLSHNIHSSLALGPQQRAVVIQVSQDSPEALAKRLAGTMEGLAKVQ